MDPIRSVLIERSMTNSHLKSFSNTNRMTIDKAHNTEIPQLMSHDDDKRAVLQLDTYPFLSLSLINAPSAMITETNILIAHTNISHINHQVIIRISNPIIFPIFHLTSTRKRSSITFSDHL